MKLVITPTVGKQDKQYTYKRNIEMRLRNHCSRGKVTSITYLNECVLS